MGPVLTVENAMYLIDHTVAFSEVLQSNMGYLFTFNLRYSAIKSQPTAVEVMIKTDSNW